MEDAQKEGTENMNNTFSRPSRHRLSEQSGVLCLGGLVLGVAYG